MGVEVKTKNGYVKIANNLFDNIFIRDFTKRELQVILLIIRLSYGFNRKYAIIEPKTYLCLVGIPRQNINRTLDSLIEKNVIINESNNIYRLNKHYDQWDVKINKHFDLSKINCLKALQFKKDVINAITESDNNSNQDDYTTIEEDVITTITPCNQNDNKKVINTITGMSSPRLQNNNNSNQDDYAEVITTITKTQNVSSSRLQEQPENIDGDGDTNQPKDIIKDNIKTYIKDISYKGNEEKSNTKKFDPYFNNPIVDSFKKEYEKNFKTQRCYLDNFKINKLLEIAVDNPDFVEKLPEIVKKFSKLKFTNAPATLKWLINDGGWAGILNGEYDQFIEDVGNKGTKKYNEDNGWTL